MSPQKRLYFAILTIFAFSTAANAATDALGDKGQFVNKTSLSGWTKYINTEDGYYTSAEVGSISFATNDAGDNVAEFWSNGINYDEWDIQLKTTITMEKGYAYTIQTGFYSYNKKGSTSRSVQMGVLDEEYTTYFAEEFENITGEYEEFIGTTYEHCYATDTRATFFINGGTQYGGFAIPWVVVTKEPATKCSPAPTSSASTLKSSSSVTPKSSSSATPHNGNRIGPVSQYGQLQAGKKGTQGRIFGSCPTYNQASGNPVKVRGMSLFWSIDETATPFYTEAAIDALVKDMKIEIIRIAMGTNDENWGGSYGYAEDPTTQESYIKTIVNAAIKNDIYVIIDWHSHVAHKETTLAKNFFSKMARLYGGYDNVIFEIYNEPATTGATATNGGDAEYYSLITWSTIYNYAMEIIPAIREYSDNLIIVGTPTWSADVYAADSKLIKDDNVAYTFHFYASSHTVKSQGTGVANAIKQGIPVFVTEWGTCTYTGDGIIDASANSSWQSWLNDYDLSAANWAAGIKDESCAAFSTKSQGYGSLAGMSGMYYTKSGSMVKGYIANSVPTTYTDCESGATTKSSSSVAKLSSSSVKPVSSSSVKPASSSSVKPTSSSSKTVASSSSKAVVPVASSSSKILEPISSASEPVVAENYWFSGNTILTNNTNDGVVMNNLVSGKKRSITRELHLNTKEDYVVSFKVATVEEEAAISIKVTDGDKKLCTDAYDISAKQTKVSCDFTASSSTATLTVSVSGTNDIITITNFKINDGTDAIKLARNSKLELSVSNRNLYISAADEIASVQVFDIMGNLVMKTVKPAGASSVSLQNIANGHYIIRVKSKSGIQSIKANIN